MEYRVSIIAIMCLVKSCLSAPLQVIPEEAEVQNDAENATIRGNLNVFAVIRNANKGSSLLLREGDIAVKSGRSAIVCPGNNTSCFWHKNNAGSVHVPYILSGYSDSDANTITQAMLDYIPMTCIRFVPRTTETDYLNISPQDSCRSYMGRIGGAQDVSLTYDCMTKGTIQHELNHALGFEHEQNRSDRDDYVRIRLQYVDPGRYLPSKLRNSCKEYGENQEIDEEKRPTDHDPAWASEQQKCFPKPDSDKGIDRNNFI